MKIILKQLVATMIIWLFVNNSYAALINYDESISGEIVGGLNFGVVTEAGINTFSGSVNEGSNLHDYFVFGVSPALQISQVTINYNYQSNYTGNSTFFYQAGLLFGGFYADNTNDVIEARGVLFVEGPYIEQEYGDFLIVNEFESITSSYPVPGSQYNLFGGFINGENVYEDTSNEVVLSWTFTVTTEVIPVSTVPLPASIWLFLSGLSGLTGVVARHKF